MRRKGNVLYKYLMERPVQISKDGCPEMFTGVMDMLTMLTMGKCGKCRIKNQFGQENCGHEFYYKYSLPVNIKIHVPFITPRLLHLISIQDFVKSTLQTQ